MILDLVDALVKDDVPVFHRPAQEHPLKGPAPAEGHVDLAMSESAVIEVNDQLVKGQALAFVNGDGPTQAFPLENSM